MSGTGITAMNKAM